MAYGHGGKRPGAGRKHGTRGAGKPVQQTESKVNVFEGLSLPKWMELNEGSRF